MEGQNWNDIGKASCVITLTS